MIPYSLFLLLLYVALVQYLKRYLIRLVNKDQREEVRFLIKKNLLRLLISPVLSIVLFIIGGFMFSSIPFWFLIYLISSFIFSYFIR
jgi:hypothetical protein